MQSAGIIVNDVTWHGGHSTARCIATSTVDLAALVGVNGSGKSLFKRLWDLCNRPAEDIILVFHATGVTKNLVAYVLRRRW